MARLVILKVYYGFSTTACPPTLLMASWSSKLTFPTPCLTRRINTNWHKLTTMWKASWGLSHWETHDNLTTSNITP